MIPRLPERDEGRYQIVLCDGPRCRARGGLQSHAEHLTTRLGALPGPSRVFLASHTCLGRCPAGPSLVVREIASDEPGESPDPRPGMYALSGGCHYHHVTLALLDRIVDEHCQGAPLEGRYQPY